MKRLFLSLLVLLCCARFAASQSTIFLVRHAEKAEDAASPKDPSLSEAGRARAESLAAALKDARITAIFASEYKRTQQTAEPLARAASISVRVIPATQTEALVSKLKESKGNSLVVAHSNTLAEIVRALGTETSFTIEEADYDNLFVLTLTAPPQLLRLHYR